jgi:hypothetical protein
MSLHRRVHGATQLREGSNLCRKNVVGAGRRNAWVKGGASFLLGRFFALRSAPGSYVKLLATFWEVLY